jgi:hypothetical protein
MKVRELIAELQKQNPEAEVLVQVGWSDDTLALQGTAGRILCERATSDKGEPVEVKTDSDDVVVLSGWTSNCKGDLEFVEEEDEG